MSLSPMPAGRELTLSPGDRERRVAQTLVLSVVEGSLFAFYFAWTTGAVLTGFLIYLGAGPLLLAAAGAAGPLAQALSPLAATLASRLKQRGRFIAITAGLGRILWLPMALLPLSPIPLFWWPGIAVLLILLSNIMQNWAGIAWIDLMGDVVPQKARGRYFGFRNSIIGLAGTAAAVLAGLYLDVAAKPAGFQMLMIAAVMAAIAASFCYPLYYDPPGNRVPLSLLETMRVPLRDRQFRVFLLFVIYWNAAVLLAAPFVIPYFLQHLQMSYTHVAIWGAIASVCGLATGPMWGRAADRYGHKTVLVVTTIVAGTLHPLCWMLATPGHFMFVWISGFVDAFAWAGINAAMFNLSLASAPPRYRMSYMAMLGLAGGLAGCAASLLAGPLLAFLLAHPAQLGPFAWTGYHSLFLISGFLRSQGWRFLRHVDEPHASSTQDMLRDFILRVRNVQRARHPDRSP